MAVRPALLALAISITSASASSVRDDAGMFDPEAVRKAEAKLNRIEARDTGPDHDRDGRVARSGKSLERSLDRRAKRSGHPGDLSS